MVSRMQDIILNRTNITKQQLSRRLKTDWYLEAKEQVENGLCSAIVTDITQIL